MTEPAHRGFFISFEGTEGSGKTTQLRLLVQRLRNQQLTVVDNQEPGTTAIGNEIRRLLLDPAHQEMAAMTELLLMFASRAQATAEIITPALHRGDIVVTDRYTDSTLAYQGEARGLGFERVWDLHRLALGTLLPDLTICLALDVQAGLARAHRRNEDRADANNQDRFDRQSAAFHARVLEGYRRIATLEPERFRMVDATGTREAVAERIWAEVSPRLLARLSVTE